MNDEKSHNTKMSRSKRFNESTFTIKCPVEDVFRLLLDVSKNSDWAIVPGCTSLKQAVLTSKSTSGTATSYVLVGKEDKLCHVKILQTNTNRQIITECHVAPPPTSPLKSNSELRDYCLEKFHVTFKNEWNLQQSKEDESFTSVNRIVSGVYSPPAPQSQFDVRLLHQIVKAENASIRNKWGIQV
jgi:hypothetical protein